MLAAICAHGSQTAALTIETLFVPEGQTINGIGVAEAEPIGAVGGGNLPAIMRAAADVWESLITDDHTLTLNFGWAPTNKVSSIAFHQGLAATGDPRRQVLGSLAFNSNYSSSVPLYLDPTPWVSEEFGFNQQKFDNLGGGFIEVMRERRQLNPQFTSARDLYSTALHEIGHALGLAGWAPFVEETEDGDIDIVSGPFTGTTIPLAGDHFNIEGPIMTNLSHPPGLRRDVTQIDVLAVCYLNEFTGCNLSRRSMFSASDINFDDDVDGNDYLAAQQIGLPATLRSEMIAKWSDDYGSPLFPHGDYNHDRQLSGADFLAWQLGQSPAPVSAADLTTWRQNTYASTTANSFTVVPEPTTWLLLSCFVILAGRVQRACR